MPITDRDRQILHVLTRQLRVGTAEQFATLWADGSPKSVQRRLAVLVRWELLATAEVVLLRIPVTEPLVSVECGGPAPQFGPLAWLLQKRWERGVRQRVTIYWASALTVRLFGGVGGRLRQPFQLAHDLLVSDVYVLQVQQEPTTAQHWLGEDFARQQQFAVGKVPDAFLLNPYGDIERVIEIGGQYSANRLRALHRHCDRHGWSYEIW